MRLKGINPIEQNVEKVFVGVFVVALLGVLAMQFIGKENTVKVDKNDVPIANAYVEIAKQAKVTDERIKQPKPDNLPDAKGDEAVKQLSQFDTRYQGPVSPGKELAVALDRSTGNIGNVTGKDDKNLAALAALVIPAPSTPIVATIQTEVDPIEVQQNADVATVLPPKAPYDKASITIETVFDGAALKAALMADPDSDGPIRAIPKSWWDGTIQILGIVGERQMLKPDGAWSDPEPIKLMPGRLSFVGELDKLNTATQLKDAMRAATERADAIRRPDYYAARYGEAWAPPTERESRLIGEAEKVAEIAKLTKDRDAKIKSRIPVQKQLDEVGHPQAPGGGAGGGGGGGGGAGGGGGRGAGGGRGSGGAAPPPSAPSGPSSADESRKKQLTQRLATIDREIAEIEAKLRALGEKVGTAPQDQANNPGMAGDKKNLEAALLENPGVRLWVHDVHVERGRTYRYRLIVAMNNPYFGHSAAMPASQAELAKSGIIRSVPTDWSAPVQVDPETQLFFTSATPDDQDQRAATAKAEVFQFKWGFWRRGQVTLSPGDSVTTELRVPDYDKVIAANPDAAPAGDQQGGPGGRGGGKGGFGGGQQQQGQPQQPDDKAAQVPMIVVPVLSDTIMLGVEGIASGGEQVLVRDTDGTVIARSPEHERQSSAYKRAAASAEKGEKDLKAKPKVNPAPGPGGRPNQDLPPRDNRPGQGGGGGGG